MDWLVCSKKYYGKLARHKDCKALSREPSNCRKMLSAKFRSKALTVLEIRDKYHECTSLYLAAQNGHINLVKLLVRAGADVESENTLSRETPLGCAARNGHLEVVKFLVKEAGADVESKSFYGWTPLGRAAQKGHLEAVRFLVEEGCANVKWKDVWEQTPLNLAAEDGHLEVVKFLVKEAGADIESKTMFGKTALDLVRQAIRIEWPFGDREGRKAVAAWLEEEIMNRESRAGLTTDGH